MDYGCIENCQFNRVIKEHCDKPCEFVIKNNILTEIKNIIFKKDIVIPEGVIKIADKILEEADTIYLEKIVFPTTLIDIGEENFTKLENLKEVIINDNFVFDDNCLYSKDYKKLLLCLRFNKRELIVKDGCEHIGSYAFTRCDTLRKIVLPESVKVISDYAFYDCINVEEIVLPKMVDSIGYCAFENCIELCKINLPLNLKKISDRMFYSCGIKSLKLPESIIYVDESDCGISFVNGMYTKLILKKSNIVVENYCNKYGILYEFENAKQYRKEEARDVCIKYGKQFIKLFKKNYFAKDYHEREKIYPRLQSIYNKVALIKIEGQGYIFDNQIRKWFLSNKEEISFNENDKMFNRYYDRFCSFLLVYKGVFTAIMADEDY